MPVDVFAGVPENELRLAGRRRTFSRGEVVFHEGDPGDSLHRVTRGRFAARVTTPRRRCRDVRRALAGRGVRPARRAPPRRAPDRDRRGARAGRDVRAARERIRAHQGCAPGGRRSPSSSCSSRCSRRRAIASSRRSTRPVHLRVRARLRDLARIYGGSGTEPVTIPLSQEDLAGLVGTTRETVNRVLQDEQERGHGHRSRAAGSRSCRRASERRRPRRAAQDHLDDVGLARRVLRGPEPRARLAARSTTSCTAISTSSSARWARSWTVASPTS